MRVALFTARLLAASPTIARADAVQRFQAMTPEAAQRAVTFKDDTLETVVTLTTARVFQEKRGLLGLVPFDVFLRAFVDKATGAARFQLYADIHYTAPLAANWNLVNYETPAGPKAVKLNVLDRIRGRCSRYLGCDRTETVACFVAEAVLRAKAAAYRPDALVAWTFKLKAQNGEKRIDGLSAAEIAGLLRAVDAYRADHH